MTQRYQARRLLQLFIQLTAVEMGASTASGFLGSVGVTKALTLFVYIGVGLLLRKRFDAAASKGIRMLIMQVMLPCVTFKGLVGIELDWSALQYPLFSATLILFLLVWGWLTSSFVLPPSKVGSDIPARTAMFMTATLAPGLTSFAFVNEFGPSGAAGIASLMDISVKFILLFFEATMMRWMSPTTEQTTANSEDVADKTSKESRAPNLLARVVNTLCADNLNFAILGGLAMSATGSSIEDIGFIGSAITTMAKAQTPVLFVLIGLTVTLSGNTPLVSCIILLFRVSGTLIFVGLMNRCLEIPPDVELVTTLFGQAAISVIAFGILSEVVDSQSKSHPSMNKSFAFDMVGYSFPVSVILNTTASLTGKLYTNNLLPIGISIGLGAALLCTIYAKDVQSAAVWSAYLKRNS